MLQRRHHPHEFIITPVLTTVPKDGQEGSEEKKKKNLRAEGNSAQKKKKRFV